MNIVNCVRKAEKASRTAIVTGAGRGIGRAIAFSLAEIGFSVIVVARTLSEVDSAMASIRSDGGKGVAICADVSNWSSVQSMVQRTIDMFGRIDVLVNNAGIQGKIGPFFESDIQEWNHTIQINLLGTAYCTRAVLPFMVSQNCGKIVNLSGGGATAPRPNFSAYAASKAAIVRFTETLAEEVKTHNIQINAVAPGAINTRMLEEILAVGEEQAGAAEMQAAMHRVHQGGDTIEHAVKLVAFLASDASGTLTGKLISAVHDPWREWAGKSDELNTTPLYTLRRLDPHTVKPIISAVTEL